MRGTRFKIGDLVEYNITIQSYVPAADRGIGIVIAQRATDILVYSIRESKEILIRERGTKLLSGVERGR